MEKSNGQYTDLARDPSTHCKHWMAALEVTMCMMSVTWSNLKVFFPERIVAYLISLREVNIVARNKNVPGVSQMLPFLVLHNCLGQTNSAN